MWPMIALLTGIALCVGGGLLGLLPNPEKPGQFVPLYLLAGALFLGGLAMVFWFQRVGESVARLAAG